MALPIRGIQVKGASLMKRSTRNRWDTGEHVHTRLNRWDIEPRCVTTTEDTRKKGSVPCYGAIGVKYAHEPLGDRKHVHD